MRFLYLSLFIFLGWSLWGDVSMYNKFIARQVERPWADIAQDCFVVGLFAGCVVGGWLL